MTKQVIDFDTEVTTDQMKVLYMYVEGRGPAQYAAARKVLYSASDYWSDFEWHTNFDEWMTALGNPETVTIYRGSNKRSGDIFDQEATSWTTDKRVAEWHASLSDDGVIWSVTLPADETVWGDFFIFALESQESEVMVNHEFFFDAVYSDFTQEAVTKRTGDDNVSLKEYLGR
ncbi:MAG: hypothetical protein ACRDCE_17995 [Cetobacterium sp.]|uniref:hypothetical protein n=1 Tax=Cetobacterium sp. TaxID=2071632 RepID=UPI003EE55282